MGAQAAAPGGGLDGGPAGIRGARGAACSPGPVPSRLSRVGPRAGRREGRGGGGGTRSPPSLNGNPASGAPWWTVAGPLLEMGESEAFNPGSKSRSLPLLLT